MEEVIKEYITDFTSFNIVFIFWKTEIKVYVMIEKDLYIAPLDKVEDLYKAIGTPISIDKTKIEHELLDLFMALIECFEMDYSGNPPVSFIKTPGNYICLTRKQLGYKTINSDQHAETYYKKRQKFLLDKCKEYGFFKGIKKRNEMKSIYKIIGL